MLNHSCAPNARVLHGSGVAGVVADEGIPAGTEVCVSYVDLGAPLSARRKALRRMFFFDCTCPRCVDEAASGSAKQCWGGGAGAAGARAPKRRGRKARVSRGCV